jgi:hypothetical protein
MIRACNRCGVMSYTCTELNGNPFNSDGDFCYVLCHKCMKIVINVIDNKPVDLVKGKVPALAKRIWELNRERLTQTQIAKKLGVSQTTISHYINQHLIPNGYDVHLYIRPTKTTPIKKVFGF